MIHWVKRELSICESLLCLHLVSFSRHGLWLRPRRYLNVVGLLFLINENVLANAFARQTTCHTTPTWRPRHDDNHQQRTWQDDNNETWNDDIKTTYVIMERGPQQNTRHTNPTTPLSGFRPYTSQNPELWFLKNVFKESWNCRPQHTDNTHTTHNHHMLVCAPKKAHDAQNTETQRNSDKTTETRGKTTRLMTTRHKTTDNRDHTEDTDHRTQHANDADHKPKHTTHTTQTQNTHTTHTPTPHTQSKGHNKMASLGCGAMCCDVMWCAV